MTPGGEVADVDGVAAVRSRELGHLGVVHGVREHEGDLAGREAGANVLAVVAVTGGSTKGVNIASWIRMSSRAYFECAYTQLDAICAAYCAIVSDHVKSGTV